MNSLSLAERLMLMAFGYFIAAISAALVAVIVLAAFVAPGGVWSLWPDGLWLQLYFGGLFSLFCGLPSFVVTMVLADQLEWRHWSRFAAAGAANVLPAMWIGDFLFGENLFSVTDLPLAVACLCGGLAGGYAFWVATGRYLYDEP